MSEDVKELKKAKKEAKAKEKAEAALAGDEAKDLDVEIEKLRKTHLHNKKQMEDLHQQLEKEFNDLTHADMFARVKGHIYGRYVKALEYRRQKLSILQTWIEAEINNQDFNRESVNPDLHGLITKIEKRCKALEGSYDFDNQTEHNHNLVNEVYTPGRIKQMVNAAKKRGKKLAALPVKMIKMPFTR